MYKTNINLNLYKTFYDVVKYGSISKAAKYSFTSQPAVSKAIKKLEEELNIQLFYRNLNGVLLTDKGKELLYFVEKSYSNLIIAERTMLETENLEIGKLSIGMPSNIGSFFLFSLSISLRDMSQSPIFLKKFRDFPVAMSLPPSSTYFLRRLQTFLPSDGSGITLAAIITL